MPAPIPLELQEQVLDHLLDDTTTLKQCSFVCRAWTPRTRSYLFRKFSAHYRSPNDCTPRCRPYVEHFLYLAVYVREIEIQDSADAIFLTRKHPAHTKPAFGDSELLALCSIFDHLVSLRKITVSSKCGDVIRDRYWPHVSAKFRTSLEAVFNKFSSSLTHILMYGFFFDVSHVRMFRGLDSLQYLGLEAICAENESTGLVPFQADDSLSFGSIQTLSLNFHTAELDPVNGLLLTRLVNTLRISNLRHLRLGGANDVSILEALPLSWSSTVVHFALELTILNPTIPWSPLSPTFTAKLPEFRALRVLELSLNIEPLESHHLNALKDFMNAMLPPSRRLDELIVTIAAVEEVPVDSSAVSTLYEFCLSRAEVVRIQWEDGKLDILGDRFPDLFATGAMKIGHFLQDHWFAGISTVPDFH
ncbi:hypothetical protein R3P38DRAFT_3523659 [Favolaschia claudopus]|uniref:F-box domain-containing protein n=1 Tax=Favolaschia claudopus TaxID=2862362 RepID=A0AAW0E7S9_9AGAR